MADDCRLWYSSCPALDREVRSWHGSASNASLETHVLPQIDVFIGSSNQGLANRLGVFYFAVMLAAALNPDARPIRSQPALKMVGGVFYGFPGVTVHEQEVKRVHLLARRTELLCWTDWQHPPANKLDLSGCGNPNAHEVNILSLCETLTSVMRKRPRSITIGTYYHPSIFSHPWFRQFDRLVPELYAPPQPQPAPRTAIMHMRRCFVDPPYDVFVAECGAADPHFYPSLPSAYFANILGHYPQHQLSAAVTPECRSSTKLENLRSLFPHLNISGDRGKNDQRVDFDLMMSAEVFIGDVGSFSAWVAYLRGLLFDGVSHMPLVEYKPIRHARAREDLFGSVPSQLVDSSQHAALGVSPSTIYHLVNHVSLPSGESAWFLKRKSACTAFEPAQRPDAPTQDHFNETASITLAMHPSPCRPAVREAPGGLALTLQVTGQAMMGRLRAL